jgi:shikimate dehydrogenase
MVEQAFEHHDIDWAYHTVEVKPEGLADAIRGMRAMGFIGGHVSHPHKEAVLPLLDRCGETAEVVGALNVVYREGDALLGDNFEGRGLVAALRRVIDPADRRVVVLGTGRAARAAACELARLRPAQIAIHGRNVVQASALAELLKAKFELDVVAAPWEADLELPPETGILVHATTIGREDPNSRVPLCIESLSKETVVADMTADPPDTRFIREAAEHGCRTIEGLSMYVEQVAEAVALWTGTDPDRGVMREAIDEFLEV